MKDEKCNCGCDCCGKGTMMHHHGGGKHWLMTIGIVAFVYGLVSWAMVTYMWPVYTAWMVGGALLILIAWIKKMKKHMMMKE